MHKIFLERNLDFANDEKTLKIANDHPYAKVTINGKEYENGTYTSKISDGSVVSSNPTTVIKEETKEKDTRTFWQRHPWLRVLLTIFLCLLLIGLLMIAAYHIMHAINNSRKNDKIDDAKEADKNLKDAESGKTKAESAKTEAGKVKTTAESNLSTATTDKATAKTNLSTATTEKTAAEANLSTAGFTSSEINAIKNGTFSSSSLTSDQQSALNSYNNAVYKYNTAETAYNNAVNKYNAAETTYNNAVNDYNTAETNYNNAVNSVTDNQKTLSDIAKDNGVTYNAGTTTVDEITKGIENTYADKFPKSNGAFRITGDALAATGAAGLIGTGIAALIANNKDKKEKTVVQQDVDNGYADNSTKTITRTTTTVTR